MRRRGVSWVVFVMLFAATGCDGGSDDGPNAAEVFIGDWRLSSLLITTPAGTTDFIPFLPSGTTVGIDFETMAFSVTITTDSPPPTTILGTYSLNEGQETITLTSSSFDNPITIDYEINNDDQITLESNDTALFIGLTGIDPEELLGLPVERITLVVQRAG